MINQKKIHHHSLTSFFLESDKLHQLKVLMKEIKLQYRLYEKEDIRRYRLRNLSLDMWNSLQNEFYMTANICQNTIWQWQDKFDRYHESGYFLEDKEPCELTDWSMFLKSWTDQEWTRQVLNLVKDFNLDNQKPEYVVMFQNDFKSVRNREQFCSVVTKWMDLIYWSPWKLSLYDNCIPQPKSAHYDDDFNPEYEEADYE